MPSLRNLIRSSGTLNIAGFVYLVLCVWLLAIIGCDGGKPAAQNKQTIEIQQTAQDDDRILEAYQKERSGFEVESSGIVQKILKDDVEGIPHQRFIVLLANGHSILIAHNTDLAPRIKDLKKGDLIKFKGEFEWNNKGGVVHWTHHAPAGSRHESGWLEYKGQRYE